MEKPQELKKAGNFITKRDEREKEKDAEEGEEEEVAKEQI